MRRTHVSKYKLVGNRQNNIEKEIAAGPAVSYNCVESDINLGDWICVDPGDGSGTYPTIQDCTDSGCEFDPLNLDGMALWLHAKEDDILILSSPYISKWKDKRWPNPALEFMSIGLGDNTYPSWDPVGEYVTFDGEDYMQTNDPINLNTETDLGWCIAVTMYKEDWAEIDVIIGDADSNNNLIKFSSDVLIQMKLWNPDTSSASTKGVTINNPASLLNQVPYVFIFNMNPTTNDAYVWINGIKQTAAFAFPDGFDFTKLDEIGAKNSGQLGLAGGIKEIIIYKGELTDTQVGQLNFYMHNQL